MSASDALIQPIYNCRYRESISLVDSNGAPIASSAPDTEISKDSAAFAAATNELTAKTGTPVGECYIDFTYAEMGAQEVRIVPKSTGALTRGFSLFPQRLPVLRSGTAQAGAVGSITLDSGASAKDGAYVGCWVRASNNTPVGIQGQVRKISGYTGSTKVATVAPNWDNTPTSSTTFEVLVPSDMSVTTLLATLSEITSSVGIPKNQAFSFKFMLVNSTDHVSPITGRTVSGQRCIDGGALVAVGGTFAEVGSGSYRFVGAAADYNGDEILFIFSASGADDRFVSVKTAE